MAKRPLTNPKSAQLATGHPHHIGSALSPIEGRFSGHPTKELIYKRTASERLQKDIDIYCVRTHGRPWFGDGEMNGMHDLSGLQKYPGDVSIDPMYDCTRKA